MKRNVKKLRNEQIERLFIALKGANPGSTEYEAIIKAINDLTSRKDNSITARDIIEYALKIFGTITPIMAVIISNAYFYKIEHKKEEIVSKQQQNISQRLIKF